MRQKPSEQIRSHLQGTGTGFELDDLMTRRIGGIYEEISSRLEAIHQRYRTSEYPIGTSNPASFASLEELAVELQQQGL